jgi:predicted RND superfamily exporter protein
MMWGILKRITAIQYVWLVLSLFAIIITYAGFQVLEIPSNYNVRQFFPRVNPLMRQDEIVSNKFKLDESSPFLIVASLAQAPDDWSTQAHLDQVKSLVAAVEQIPNVDSVKALTNIQGAILNKETLGIGLVIDYLTPENFKKEIRKNPVLSPYFISKDAKILTIVVRPHADDGKINPALGPALLHEAQKQLPFAEVSLGGVPAIQSDMNTIIQKEVVHFVLISALMSLIALLLIFRNLSPVFVCCSVALGTNILSVWGISLAGFTFNILSSSIPILVTMTVLSICLHSILRLIERQQQVGRTISKMELIRLTFVELLRPNALTALTTSVGFFALALSDSPAIRDFGISVGIGLLFTMFATSLLLPALLIVCKRPQLRSWMTGKARWTLYIFKFHRWALVLVVGLSILGGWRGQYLSWTAKLFDDLPEDHSVRGPLSSWINLWVA